MKNWNEFPYPDDSYDYEGPALEAAWEDLHVGDREPFPEDETLQDAWRCYHRGEFQRAVEIADEAGLAGHAVANKATGIYASIDIMQCTTDLLWFGIVECPEGAIRSAVLGRETSMQIDYTQSPFMQQVSTYQRCSKNSNKIRIKFVG